MLQGLIIGRKGNKFGVMDNFDFDEWAVLAREAPDEFEQRRRDAVENYISTCDDNCRMQRLQCRIDLERIRARTPLKSCLRLSTLMWDAFMEFNNELTSFIDGDCEITGASSHVERSAKILHIPTDHKSHK